LKGAIGLLSLVLAMMAVPATGQRRPVLPQIDEPHPYYYRELYLPQLTSGPSSLTWGPDSEELIYSMAGSLWRQTLGNRNAEQLTDGAGYDYQPDWSPDGKSVVYVTYQNDAMELWLLDLPTGKTHALTSGSAVNVEPRWSPDGKRILWVSTEYNKRFHIFAAEFVNGELKNKTRLTGETKSSLPRYYYSQYDIEINPTWSRDGKEILFVSNKDHIYGTGGFWTMKAEPGSEAREIHYEETSWKARPEFSPDGSRLVYSSYLGRQWHNLWLMPANGGDAFPVTYADWDQTGVRWSPDGQKIAFISNERRSTAICWQELHRQNNRYLVLRNLKYLHQHGTLFVNLEAGAKLSSRARISITGNLSRSFAPGDAWIQADDGYDRSERQLERHYFSSTTGPEQLEVPVGKITVEVSRGFEEKPFKKVVEIKEGKTTTVNAVLEPLDFNLTHGEHWVASDLHVHMNYGGTYKTESEHLVEQSESEGLDVIHELTVNKEQRFPDIEFLDFGNPDDDLDKRKPTLRDPDVHIVQGQEFHTSYWGHRGILHLKTHLLVPGYAGYPNTAAASLYPMNADVYDMAKEQGAVVGAVHPFDDVPDPFAKPAQRITDELPVDVALGKLDYMEIVGFSDHKSTAAVWYKLLNLGFKVPAGAGTDATTDYAAPIRGTVGQDRVYVLLPGGHSTIDVYIEKIKEGRTFATNGPLVEFSLGGKIAGDELNFETAQPAVSFTAKLRSIVPVEHLEVVCNGKVVQDLKLTRGRDSSDATGTIPISESGWCVLRAWSETAEYPVMDNYTYATTSPIYVTVARKRPYSKEDAQYFMAWIDRTIEITDKYPDWNSAQEKRLVMKRLQDAREIYEKLP
jgi:Tol biopolymer transport system component